MELLADDFLLGSDLAKTLFTKYAKAMPIIDFHCHLNPQEIYENKNYQNLTRLWLNDGTYGDHYKWRLIRANGSPERLVTGDGDDYDKFLAFAAALERAIGNPVFEWTHLELRRYFHIDQVLNRQSAPAIWAKANQLLQTEAFRPRDLIRDSNVKALCTTDDPASDLRYHRLLAAQEAENGFKVLPALRPDRLLHLESDSYGQYLEELGAAAGLEIVTFADIRQALRQRFEFFTSLGCRLSDHSLETFHFAEADEASLDAIVAKAAAGQALSELETRQYWTMTLEELMRLNNEFGWTMQFHLNVTRNVNPAMFAQIGADTGFDMMGAQPDIVGQLQRLFSRMSVADGIPKTIFYSLNQNDWLMLATLMQCFQGEGRQRLQLGAAWWFNDTAESMDRQLQVFAQQSLLSNFVGMLTDSRSFLSYPRHEYFRRVLCDFLGRLAAQGRLPADEEFLGQVVQDISYNNAHDYFGFFE